VETAKVGIDVADKRRKRDWTINYRAVISMLYVFRDTERRMFPL
jgi:hypothetical protein